MKEFEKKNVTADSLGNVILIKPITNNEKFRLHYSENERERRRKLDYNLIN
jgi:hypothetical protein